MVEITRQNFIKNLVLMTGLTRSGKTMLAPIISSMDRVEHVALNYLMEQIPMMHILGLIPDKTAVCMMRYAVDAMFYDRAIGRNLNLRFSDLSSVWKSTEPLSYIRRLFAQEGDVVLARIEEKDSIFLLMVHDALWHADLYFQSFPTMRMIHLTRHPISMVYDWFSKGYGADFFENPRNATLTVKCESRQLPYYAAGWEREFLNMSEIDRIIHMIRKLEDDHHQKYNSLSLEVQRRVMIVSFEKMVTDPAPVLNEISKFLGTALTRHTGKICKRERCPRALYRQDQEKELNAIKARCSKDAFEILMFMSKQYEDQFIDEGVYS